MCGHPLTTVSKIFLHKLYKIVSELFLECLKTQKNYRSFSSDVTAAILVYQNNEMAAILVYSTGISSFLFKYFVLFHHPTGATDHVSENDLYIFACFFSEFRFVRVIFRRLNNIYLFYVP
jgi:hypothetical protein